MDEEGLRAAGVFDPDAPDAEARRALLTYLDRRGATTAQLVAAHRRGRLASLAGELVVRPRHQRLSLADAAAQLDVDPERIRRVLRAAGLGLDPDDPLPVTDAEVEVLEAFEAGALLVGDPSAMALARLLGNAAARVAEAAVEVFAQELHQDLVPESADELARSRVAVASLEAIGLVPAAYSNLLHQHLHRAVERSIAERVEGEPDHVVTTIGFVDLVGSTAWTRSRTDVELHQALDLFESAAFDIAAAHGGWVVKLVGDCAMFEVADPVAACRIGLELCAVAQASDVLPPARGGVAAGVVHARDGDYFGSTVNLAARAEPVAEPSTLAVNDAVAEAVQEAGVPAEWELRPLEPQVLRGFDRPSQLWIVSGSVRSS